MWTLPDELVTVSGRARLTRLQEQDAEWLFRALDHDEVWRVRPDPRPASAADYRDRVSGILADMSRGLRWAFTVRAGPAGEIVGTTGYLDLMPDRRSLEIGATAYSPAWQRTFLNTECKLALMGHAFAVMRCVRVSLLVDTRNARSIAAVERIGAVREGTLRNQRICWDGFIRDAAVFSVIDSEWPAVEARLRGLLARHPAEPPGGMSPGARSERGV
ncbi:MAG: GNAT family N-acetyltransferase [Phycisphaerales bacterium]|nr:GNAT family N-acetyltransferase [Phycisphaerales bacterium]